MLPPYIIEQIRERERAREEAVEQPVLELPLAPPRSRERRHHEDSGDRGVVVIDLM